MARRRVRSILEALTVMRLANNVMTKVCAPTVKHVIGKMRIVIILENQQTTGIAIPRRQKAMEVGID
jgi:hypothetical protein